MVDLFELAWNEQFSKIKEILQSEQEFNFVNKKQENFVHFLLNENEEFLLEIL